MTPDRATSHERSLLESVVCWIAFSLPLYVIGFPLGGYDFTLLTAFVIGLDALILFRGRFAKTTSTFIILILLWCFLSTVGRNPPSVYAFSLIGLGVVLLPFCGTLPRNIDRGRVLRWLMWGAVVSFIFVAYELSVNFFGLPPFEDVITLGNFSVVHTNTVSGFRRVKAADFEPSHYAQYLVFVYAIVDISSRRGLDVPKCRFFKAVLFVALIATLSLTGVVLMATYIASSYIFNLEEKIVSHFFRVRTWLITGIILLFLSAVGFFYNEAVSNVLAHFTSRVEQTIYAARNGIYTGSEGSRIQSTLIVFDYWSSQDIMHVLSGEGYGNQEEWLIRNFGYLPEETSSFARGSLHNIFSNFGITTGIVGVILYVGVIMSIAHRKSWSLPLPFVVLWLVTHGATGAIVVARLWCLVLVAQIVVGGLKNSQ